MQTPSAGKMLQYGLIAFPLSFAGLPIYLHAPDFYAVNMRVPIELIGSALLLLRFFDALQDPLIGSFSDRFCQYRKLIILVGTMLLISGIWMIFHPYTNFPLFWLCLSVLICTTGFSIVTINVQALGGLWHVKKDDVTKIMGVREAIGLCGLLAASMTPALLFQAYSPRVAFHYLTLAFIPFMLCCVWIFIGWMQSASFTASHAVFASSLSFKNILQDKKTGLFLGSYFLSTVAASIPAILIIFYVRDYLRAEQYLGMFLLIYFLSGALAMPLWSYIARRYSTILTWWISMVVACLTFIWVFFLSPGDIWGYALVCLMSGFAVGANLALSSAIAANMLVEKQHQQIASRYYSLMAFLAKAALALATGIVLPLLGFLGYQPGEITTGYLMPTIYAVIPCSIQLLAIMVLWRLVRTPVAIKKGENNENFSEKRAITHESNVVA